MDTKAGIIPYYRDSNGTVKMLFMVSSDPKFGGPRPQIAKGDVDEGEAVHHAAVREGIEELGLRTENCSVIKHAWDGTFRTSKHKYYLYVFTTEINDPKAFDKPHFETEYTVWMTLDEYKRKGRSAQLPIVQKLADNLGVTQ